MTKKRLGDKGFSLLELLIGITMLAIIVVPILHAFLTSSKTSGKAKEVRNQTVAAQNILESYEATNIDTIMSNPSALEHALGTMADIVRVEQLVIDQNNFSHYDVVTDFTNADTDGPGYKLYLNGITSGSKTYDAVLTLDASKYSKRNKVGIVDYKPMDAVYIQPEPLDDSNPDVIAAKYIASQAQIDSGTEVPFSYFLNGMTRKVTVTIQKIGTETGVVSCAALFEYSARFTYTLTDDSTDPPTETTYERDYAASVNNDFYSGSYSQSENRIYGLYFFFYPNVGDRIEIVNRDNIGMGVYLIRQTAVGVDPVIVLREKYDPQTKPPHAQLYYNRAQHSYRYYIGYPGGDYWYSTNMFNGDLIGTPAQNRIYGVTVALYKAGSVHANGSVAGTPLVTFDASSLE